MMINVAQVMTSPVRTCRVDDSLAQAARLMWESDFGCVPIVDDGDHVVGMVTDRDICMAAYTQNRPLTDIAVGNVMAKRVHVCAGEDSLKTAQQIMEQNQVRRLPVVGDGGKLVGILTLNDLARAAARGGRRWEITPDAVESTLAAISQPRA